jgi:hypothetical protein
MATQPKADPDSDHHRSSTDIITASCHAPNRSTEDTRYYAAATMEDATFYSPPSPTSRSNTRRMSGDTLISSSTTKPMSLHRSSNTRKKPKYHLQTKFTEYLDEESNEPSVRRLRRERWYDNRRCLCYVLLVIVCLAIMVPPAVKGVIDYKKHVREMEEAGLNATEPGQANLSNHTHINDRDFAIAL